MFWEGKKEKNRQRKVGKKNVEGDEIRRKKLRSSIGKRLVKKIDEGKKERGKKTWQGNVREKGWRRKEGKRKKLDRGILREEMEDSERGKRC